MGKFSADNMKKNSLTEDVYEVSVDYDSNDFADILDIYK